MMSSCPKPRRERGSCYACGSADHQKRFCPRLKIARPSPPSAIVEDRISRLIEMSHSVIPFYVVQANLEIGKVTAVLDTGSPVSLLSEMCISTNVCLEPYLRDSLFQGTNQSLINILGLLKQRV